jgi:hypothetical protein
MGILESRGEEHITELEERMKRKHNLILFHLPRSKNKDREARLREEKEMINELLTEVKVDHKPLEHRRIGKFTKAAKPEEQKHRPVRLTFSSETMRMKCCRLTTEQGRRNQPVTRRTLSSV